MKITGAATEVLRNSGQPRGTAPSCLPGISGFTTLTERLACAGKIEILVEGSQTAAPVGADSFLRATSAPRTMSA
jgi:hypothetical protein